MVSFVYALLVLLVSPIWASVTEVDDSNFEEKVFGSPGKFSLVYFNSPYCSYCREFDPEFEPLGDLFQDTKLQVFKIDGLNNKRIRGKYKLVGFPVVKLFSSDGEQIGYYNGKRRTPDIIEYISDATGAQPNKLPSYVVNLGKGEDEKKIFEETDRDVLVTFYEPWDTELGNPYNSYYERLARHYAENKRNILFSAVDVTDPDSAGLVSLFQAASCPMVFFLPKGRKADEKYTVYRVDEEIDSKKLVGLLSGTDVGQKKLNLKEMQKETENRLKEMLQEDDEEDDDDDYDFAMYRDL
ncbi:DEKNAAC101289 [Brettanomyces naardenensis]|uniref:DEKNAAC101289 n=1 Tax=Brettanomyces naardenensis TaxID=13370 RepID=A0A448YHS9_BRENA|nr:DEKNAAC101289 [Brettanomyces naardenensis]